MEVYSWGANSHGQLGQGSASEQCETPKRAITTWNSNIREICGGGGHSLMLDDGGRIYGCGWNLQRQLGCDIKDQHTFARIWELSGITFTKITCGWDSSAAVTDQHILYLWGSNMYGQLGLPKEHFPNIVKPIQLELKVKTVQMGIRHTVIVDINGEIWSTGCGKRGQLGLGESLSAVDSFKKVPDIHNVEDVVCGQHHTVAWCKEAGEVYAWGDNSRGQLGLNLTIKNVSIPTKIDLPDDCCQEILGIYAGWTHTAIFLKRGEAIYFGRNDYGQLGSKVVSNVKNIVKIQDAAIKQLSLGSEHSICLTHDDSVWAWGWNEHGNTGTGSCDNVTEPMKIKCSFKNVHNVISGSGHSFVVVTVPAATESLPLSPSHQKN